MTHEMNMMDYLDWVEDQGTNPLWILDKIIEQRDFLKSQPKLGDFVPTNEKGEVITEPKDFGLEKWGERKYAKDKDWWDACIEYQSALDRILWKGWEVITRKAELVGEVTCLTCNGVEIANKGKNTHWIFNPKNNTYNELITSGIKLERIQKK